MAEGHKVATAIGTPLDLERAPEGMEVEFGAPPLVLQTQPYGFVRLERPEQIRQWEEDVQKFYGVRIDASRLGNARPCETCSCGCTDDCGYC